MDFTKYLALVQQARKLVSALPPEAQSAVLSALSEGLAGDLGGVLYHLGVVLQAASGHRHPVGAAPADSAALGVQWDALERRCREHATQAHAAGPDAPPAPVGAAGGPGAVADWLPVILQVLQLIAKFKG